MDLPFHESVLTPGYPSTVDLNVGLCGAESLARATARPLIRNLTTQFFLLHLNGLPAESDPAGKPNDLYEAVWGNALSQQPMYGEFDRSSVPETSLTS